MGNSDCKDFLLFSASVLGWRDLSEELVMDIGCGQGGNSSWRLLQSFPDIKKLIAIDHDIDMINEARYENPHPKIEYYVADIADRSSIIEWESEISKILSHYCFNCVNNQKAAFENVYRLLKPGGEAAVLLTLQANYYDWLKEVVATWSEYAETVQKDPPESHVENHRASFYENMLKEMGFFIVCCQEEHKIQEFATDLECKRFLNSLLPKVPSSQRQVRSQFQEEIFKLFLKYNSRNENGLLSLKYCVAKILVKKP